MKYIPNILSFMRLISIIPLMLLTPFELPFMMIYVISGLTDMIDGPIARKFNVTSQFGAALDGGADLLFLFVVLFKMLPLIELPDWIIIWIFVAIGMKLLAVAIGYLRHKTLILLHTYIGKFFMFTLFLFPVFYLFIEAVVILTVLLILVTIVMVEDIYINATSKEVNLDHKGILFQDR
jgi:CDP-diacylglycerol--glycerol-3-phosphate 3-phosphatidyltransferase